VFNFSLKWMLVAMAYLAVAMMGLVRPTDAWLTVVVTLAVIVLLAATATAFGASGKRRAFTSAFAACGWAYLLLTSIHSDDDDLSRLLATEQVTEIIARSVYPTDREPGDIHSGMRIHPGSAWARLRIMGCCHWALLFAILGGFVAQCLRGTCQRKNDLN